jgi:hypothetical protein
MLGDLRGRLAVALVVPGGQLAHQPPQLGAVAADQRAYGLEVHNPPVFRPTWARCHALASEDVHKVGEGRSLGSKGRMEVGNLGSRVEMEDGIRMVVVRP